MRRAGGARAFGVAGAWWVRYASGNEYAVARAWLESMLRERGAWKHMTVLARMCCDGHHMK